MEDAGVKSMNNKIARYTDLANRINAHLSGLMEEGIDNPHQIFNKMMAYLPELHDLWTHTTDQELSQLFFEYPYFKDFCVIVEELSTAERAKASREYDGLQQFNSDQKEQAAKFLGDIAQLEGVLLEMKALSGRIDSEAIHKARHTVEEWWLGVTVFKEQLQIDGFHEYGVKTWDKVATENFNRVKAVIDELSQ